MSLLAASRSQMWRTVEGRVIGQQIHSHLSKMFARLLAISLHKPPMHSNDSECSCIVLRCGTFLIKTGYVLQTEGKCGLQDPTSSFDFGQSGPLSEPQHTDNKQTCFHFCHRNPAVCRMFQEKPSITVCKVHRWQTTSHSCTLNKGIDASNTQILSQPSLKKSIDKVLNSE